MVWSTASRSPASGGTARRRRAWSTVRPAGTDAERPSIATRIIDGSSRSPPSARAIAVTVSHSSSHPGRVKRSLAGEAEGVRRRPRGESRGWWSSVERAGACSDDPHDIGEVQSVPNYHERQTASKLRLFTQRRAYGCRSNSQLCRQIPRVRLAGADLQRVPSLDKPESSKEVLMP